MLERNGVRIAAVSYDSPEILQGFAEKHGIGYPLLSDQDSAVIRRFGIFNMNIAPVAGKDSNVEMHLDRFFRT
jgi:peroxiredoxin